MKYTKEHLKYEQEIYDLPYINLVMKDIEIKEDVLIGVDPDGGINLYDKKSNHIILFGSYYAAIKKTPYSVMKKFKNIIKLKETKTTTKKTITTYSFIGEGE